MLLINPTKYTGRFADKVKEAAAQTKKVGSLFASGTNFVSCDTCPAHFAPPRKEIGQQDAWTECPNCGAQYVVTWL